MTRVVAVVLAAFATAVPLTAEAQPRTGTAQPRTGTAQPQTGTAQPQTGTAQPRTVRDDAIVDVAIALDAPSGALGADELETPLRALLAPISACLRERPIDPAELAVDLDVSARGRASARITSPVTSAQRRFARCLTRAFGAARFPERDAATRVVVHTQVGAPLPTTEPAPEPAPAPTSSAPTSSAPTSSAPTSSAPTSSAPTSSAPTSSTPRPPATEEELHARALASVQTALAGHPDALTACARRAAVQAPGRVWVRVTFPSASGAPSVDIVRSDVESDALTRCVADTMRGWTYESPGAPANVVLPVAIPSPG